MDYKFLSGTPLFQEIAKDEIEQILSCLHAREKHTRRTKSSIMPETGSLKSVLSNPAASISW